jgi:hypothetical protein
VGLVIPQRARAGRTLSLPLTWADARPEFRPGLRHTPDKIFFASTAWASRVAFGLAARSPSPSERDRSWSSDTESPNSSCGRIVRSAPTQGTTPFGPLESTPLHERARRPRRRTLEVRVGLAFR